MVLARRLIVWLTLGILAVLGWRTYVRTSRQIAELEQQVLREELMIGRIVRSAMVDEWETNGQRAAVALVRKAREGDGRTDLRWVALYQVVDEYVQPHAKLEELAPLLIDREVVVHALDRAGNPSIYTYLAVRAHGSLVGALEVGESLDEVNALVHAAIVDGLWQVGAMSLACAVVATSLGIALVGRPVRRLIEKARRIGAGRLDAPLVLRRDDELGELAREMNAMCERLRDAQARVEGETAERIRAIEQLRHADRLATVGKLASGIAHELGTPLNVCAGRAKLIQQGDARGDDAASGARIIVEQVDRMANIIRQLLDFSRRQDAPKTESDLAAAASATVSMLAPLAAKRRIDLRLAGADGPGLSAIVNVGQLQQALANLVVNAIQAMPDGGSIEVSVASERLRPPADVGGDAADYACVAVRDTGPGIPADRVRRIFEPFFTTKGVGEGTGLGLSIAWGIVRDQGGWIAVDSVEGQGACFRVYLPSCASSPAPSPSEA